MDKDEGIVINKGVRIRRADDLNIVIERWRDPYVGKNGDLKPGYWDNVGFYPSVHVACNALITGRHMHLVVKEQGTIEDLIAAIDALAKVMKKSLKGVIQ